ncbi:hypothetical protein [Actinacidiphila oryziradicis]|uniref:Uncharacterized protein n=1 Tax=Actinacidiphila oryziradicis TaxID=2571141 RepID=A0A4U0T638_9ACTN|nr:hypothetical protein [Actinacidiphila oryziradicis]TKA08195.1 hypothetical protein FCI23_29420 [Actinacidiphila oryziradicis]
MAGSSAAGWREPRWAASSGAHAAGEAWAPGTKIAAALDGTSLTGGLAMGAVSSAGGQAAADGVDILQGGKHGSDVLPDMLTSGLTGAAGGANHAGGKIYEPGEGKHRADASDPVFHPGQRIAIDGIIYGAGNAIESDLEN